MSGSSYYDNKPVESNAGWFMDERENGQLRFISEMISGYADIPVPSLTDGDALGIDFNGFDYLDSDLEDPVQDLLWWNLRGAEEVDDCVIHKDVNDVEE